MYERFVLSCVEINHIRCIQIKESRFHFHDLLVMHVDLLSATLIEVKTKRKGNKQTNLNDKEWVWTDDVFSVVLQPPPFPRMESNYNSSGILWIRAVDRRESGQQGCTTESGWKYAGAFIGTGGNIDGNASLLTQKLRSSLIREQKPYTGRGGREGGDILGVPLRVFPYCPLKSMTKALNSPLDNKILRHPCTTEEVLSWEMQVQVIL